MPRPAAEPPARLRAGLTERGGGHREGLWRRRAGFRHRPSVVELTLASAATPACRSRPAAPSRGTTRRAGDLEIHGAAKVPHANRDASRRCSACRWSRLHLYEGHVGGGFGIRGELYPEDVLVASRALRLGRPVKWIEDRREHLIAANHSRDQVHQHPRRGRRRGASSSRSTTSSGPTRAPMCAPMRRPCPI